MAASTKREALERRRRRKRIAFAVLAVGCLVGVGLAALAPHARPPATDPAPAVLAVDPPRGSALPKGPAAFRVTFSEPLAATPAIALSGPGDLPFEERFDGLVWRGDVDVPAGVDGAYVLTIAGIRDSVGRTAPDVVLPYLVDTQPPASRAWIRVGDVTSVPFDVSWDASDGNGSGVANVELWGRLDGGAWFLIIASPEPQGTFLYDPVKEARVDVYALAVDRAGNREEVPAGPQATVRFDPTPPRATLRSVEGYWRRGPVTVTATVSGAFNNGVSGVALRYHYAGDNATWDGPFAAGNATAPYAWTFGFPHGEGHYRLYARALGPDGPLEGDQGPTAWEVSLGHDAARPTGAIEPVAPYWRAEPLVVNMSAADGLSGLARVDLVYAHRPNGTAAWSPWTVAGSRSEAPWTLVFDFPSGDGRYALAARAVDRAGWEAVLPAPDDAVGTGYNVDPPDAPLALVPRWVDPSNLRANVTWTASSAPDVVGYEVHRGTDPAFVPSGCPGATCVGTFGRGDGTAWVPLPKPNVVYWIRVVAVDDGGLTGGGTAVGAVHHGLGFDTPGDPSQSAPLPVGIAWSERLEYSLPCPDCADAFRVTLDRGDTLALGLAVPSTGDYRISILDSALKTVATSDRSGFGGWESLLYEALSAGTYYVVVDWGFHLRGGTNEGWYTLVAVLV